MGKHTSINIAARCKPFSHTPGASCLIPFTSWGVRVFPTRIEIHDFFGDTLPIDLDISGPVKNFTLEQDLEKGICRVFGHSQEGYFEIHLFYDFDENSVALRYDRGDGIVLVIDQKKIELEPSEVLDLFDFEYKECDIPARERISLGVNKKQDIDLMWRRFNLQEVMPLLFYTAQSVVCDTKDSLKTELIDEESFSSFLQAGFSSIMTPEREDSLYRGLANESISSKLSPLMRIKHFHDAFRALFIVEKKKEIHLLPNLFRPFVTGRFVGAKVENALVDFSWRKGRVRTAIFHGKVDGICHVVWPKGVKGFRLDKESFDPSNINQIPVFKGKKTVVDKFIY